MNDKLKKETYLYEKRANISDIFGVNINDNFTDYDAMYQVINADNPMSIAQIFDMIDNWVKEIDDYISNIINK